MRSRPCQLPTTWRPRGKDPPKRKKQTKGNDKREMDCCNKMGQQFVFRSKLRSRMLRKATLVSMWIESLSLSWSLKRLFVVLVGESSGMKVGWNTKDTSITAGEKLVPALQLQEHCSRFVVVVGSG